MARSGLNTGPLELCTVPFWKPSYFLARSSACVLYASMYLIYQYSLRHLHTSGSNSRQFSYIRECTYSGCLFLICVSPLSTQKAAFSRHGDKEYRPQKSGGFTMSESTSGPYVPHKYSLWFLSEIIPVPFMDVVFIRRESWNLYCF